MTASTITKSSTPARRDTQRALSLHQPKSGELNRKRKPKLSPVETSADDFAAFARLLPYAAAKSAYRIAAKHFHPDGGGNTDSMTALNRLWEKLEPLYVASDLVIDPGAEDVDNVTTIQ